jgi:hypothetical protein
MAQIREITSEALQSVFRRLLPSQAGFGEDLQATNVITPVIDLTPSAEGSSLPISLQQALAHGSQTSFAVNNTTTTLTSNTGFFRIFGVGQTTTGGTYEAKFQLTDGSTNVPVFDLDGRNVGFNQAFMIPFDFIVFIATGESLLASSTTANAVLTGSFRQLADINGNLVNPSGFTAQ